VVVKQKVVSIFKYHVSTAVMRNSYVYICRQHYRTVGNGIILQNASQSDFMQIYDEYGISSGQFLLF